MKLLIQREKKQYVPDLDREVTIVEGKEYFVTDISRDFSTMHGTIKSKDLKAKDGTVVKSNQDKEFIVLTPAFSDIFRRLKRMPQSIIPKDIGAIIAETGIDGDSVCVDAGAGSGAFACFIAHIVKKVISYEINEKYLENIKANIETLGLKNITLKHQDVTQGITEKNVDLITLDLPEPWHAVPTAASALKIGGYLVGYCPHVSQAQKFLEAVKKEGLHPIKTVEVIERPWVIDEHRTRPDNISIGHTAFLTFARKYM